MVLGTPKLLYFVYVHAQSPQSYLTLCDLMDCISPGSSVHGILQARILEWDACPKMLNPLLF